MGFQTIIDNASNIKIDNRGMTATTTTRGGYTRAVSRGGQPWIFEIEFPSGPDWRDYRRLVADIMDNQRHTAQKIYFNSAGHEWIFGYQGNYGGTFSVAFTKGQRTLTLQQSATSGYNFRIGDIIQLGANGLVYQVVEDVPYTQTSVKLHRPIVEDSSTGVNTLKGQQCGFNVYCTSLPRFNMFEINQFGFDGPFVFTETYD